MGEQGTAGGGDGVAEASPMPEGFEAEPEGAVSGARVSPLPREPGWTANLNLLTEMNEPLEMALELRNAAGRWVGTLGVLKRESKAWGIVQKHSAAMIAELRFLNEVKRRDP